MTKEEIRQEAEERVNICTPYHTGSFIQGYIAGAESREEKIADLKANFDYVLEGKDLEIQDLKDRHAEEVELHLHAEDYIKSLEKENKTLEGCLLAEQEHTQMLEKENAILEKALRLYVDWADE
jgi:hypothetical protein